LAYLDIFKIIYFSWIYLTIYIYCWILIKITGFRTFILIENFLYWNYKDFQYEFHFLFNFSSTNWFMYCGISALCFEWVYCNMHIMGWSVIRVNIFIFKILIVDPNRSTWSPYEYLLADRILYFLEFFLLFFKIDRKSLDLKILDHPKTVIELS
jgi:hypothetical protein